MSDIITKMEVPLTPEAVESGYGIFVDFPPQYDKYNRQQILTKIQAAIAFIFRSFYGDHRLLPQVDGLFIDIVRYKHILDNDVSKMYLNQKVNNALQSVLIDLNPEIVIDFDPITQKMTYNITIYGNTEILVENAQDNLNATIEINNKKFYD